MSIPDLERAGRACSGVRDREHHHSLFERERADLGALPDHPGRDGYRYPGPAGPADRLVGCAVRGNVTVRSRAEADGHVRVRAGVRYYFCCEDCVLLFDADPLAYVPSAA